MVHCRPLWCIVDHLFASKAQLGICSKLHEVDLQTQTRDYIGRYVQTAAYAGHEHDPKQQRLAADKARRQVNQMLTRQA